MEVPLNSARGHGPQVGQGSGCWLGAARLAALLAGVSWAGVVVLVATVAMAVIDPPGSRPVLREPPPFGWVTTVSCGSAVVSLVVALLVLTPRTAGPSALRLAGRVRTAATVAFIASCFVYYCIVSFVYGGD